MKNFRTPSDSAFASDVLKAWPEIEQKLAEREITSLEDRALGMSPEMHAKFLRDESFKAGPWHYRRGE